MTNDETLSTIIGRIIICNNIPAFAGATVHIYLEDVSFADGRAVVMAKTTMGNVSHRNTNSVSAETEVSFKLKLDNVKIDQKAEYAIRVWIDTDNDGEQNSDDLFSDERLSVLTHGFGNEVTVRFCE